MSASPDSPHQPFSVCVASGDDEVVVTLAGELDLASAEVLERELRALRLAGAERIVVNLRQVAFMDSTGLRRLISLRSAAKRNGHRLIVVPGPAPVQRVFELTATRGLFEWRD